MADQRFRARQVRLRIGGVGLGITAAWPRAFRNARSALGEDHRMRGSKIGGERFRCVVSQTDGITSIGSRKQNPHPIEVGRQVSCGWRQSIPDNR